MSDKGGILTVEYGDAEVLVKAIAQFEGDAEKAINKVLHEEAGPLIYEEINPLINPSGRKFKGHSKSAKNSPWPRYDTDENLEITVGAKSKWHYLYFPDDGTNTQRHSGNQRFFERGGTKAVPKIVARCLTVLNETWKG